MSKELILVERTDGEKRNFFLEISASLANTRKVLVEENFMTDNDNFLLHNAVIGRKDEDEVLLQNVVGSEGKSPLIVGVVNNGLEVPDESFSRYERMDVMQKLALFENVQVYRGLTASSDKGFDKTFKPCIHSWNKSQLPASVKPSFVTEINIDSSFSEVGQSLAISSIDKTSASLNTPYGGGKTSFEYAKKHTTSSKEVRQYLTGSFYVNKIDLEVDIHNLRLLNDFESDIMQAVSAETEIDQYYNLIETLNKRGYYVPKRFSLGGVLLSKSSSEISEYKESEVEKKEFSIGFKMAIDGFGGGSDYSHTEESESSSSTTTKYSNLSLTQKGGNPNLKKYDDWIKSLNPAINWDIIKYQELYPTLALLSNKRLLHFCLNLLNTYNSYNTVKDLQTVIRIEDYATQIESLTMVSPGIG
jgi:hypothetical protein